MQNKKEKGRQAEEIAADYLAARGYSIIARNFECRIGEIDIIARNDGDLVFVEVRSRHSLFGPDPAYSVNRHKQRKILKTAQYYLVRHFRQEPPVRFDVVLVNMTGVLGVELIRDAFRADGQGF
jgi:putative endonuclease